MSAKIRKQYRSIRERTYYEEELRCFLREMKEQADEGKRPALTDIEKGTLRDFVKWLEANDQTGYDQNHEMGVDEYLSMDNRCYNGKDNQDMDTE